MATLTSEKRVKKLNNRKVGNGKFILYWMQSSHRTENNWALNYAIERANDSNQPIVVYFGLTNDFPEANSRHYWFMLEGLREAASDLHKLGIGLVVKIGNPAQGVSEIAEKASQVIVDKGYIRICSDWYRYVSEKVSTSLTQVEDNVVVPVEEASTKEEYSAATLRPKILAKLDQFLELPKPIIPKKHSLRLDVDSENLADLEKIISPLGINSSVKKPKYLQGGTTQAKELLKTFIKDNLSTYEKEGNTPENNCCSNLSPYLHFGQISPTFIATEIQKTHKSKQSRFLEQLVIRRELAINFAVHNKNYDSFQGLPEWAKKTLDEHATDPRSYSYTTEELEHAQTHDQYWNAAQKEMIVTGKMNGYMRMYWGKKIIEWTKNPQEAFKTALHLNNKYELDGRDPNGYAGVAWCFGKHDRPFKSRAIFGNVRFMNERGLERKFDMRKYIHRIEQLA